MGDIDDLLRKREAELVEQRMTTEKNRQEKVETMTRETSLKQRMEQEWLDLFQLLKVTTDHEDLDGKPFAFQILRGRTDYCFLQVGDARLDMLKSRNQYEIPTYNADFKSIYHDMPSSRFLLSAALVGDGILWTGMDTDIPQPWTTAGLAKELVRKLTDLYIKSQSAPLRHQQ